ncbi:MAG: PadR family transcriptional regulator [Alphaproteobacteria bacterium]|nr:PadR family transcriptional regulator [Alphaproteobacteria bacterium]
MRFSHHSDGHESHEHRSRHRGGRHGFGRGGWGESEDGHRGGGGRRRRVFDSGELRLLLLKLIADQPRHGYELIRAIEELSGGVYVPSPGVVYPTLTMLQEMGQIEEAASDGARKAFAVTAEGTAHLAARAEEIPALLDRLAKLAHMRERSDGGPVRRAMQNLKTVLMDRLDREGVKTETLHQIASILDDASQKIERL